MNGAAPPLTRGLKFEPGYGKILGTNYGALPRMGPPQRKSGLVGCMYLTPYGKPKKNIVSYLNPKSLRSYQDVFALKLSSYSQNTCVITVVILSYQLVILLSMND